MAKRILTFIQHRAGGPAIAVLLVVAGLLTFVMNGTDLSFSTPTIEEHADGVAILDMRLSYGPDDADELYAALGPDGRRAYRTLHLVPDTLFPIAYSLAFAFTAAWFLVRLLPLDHRLQWLSLAPLISGGADLLENLSLVVYGLAYPPRVDWLARTASALTAIKWGLMPVGVILLVAIVVAWLARGRPASNVPVAVSTGG